MAASLTVALGQEVRYNSVTPEQYRALVFFGQTISVMCLSSRATSRNTTATASHLDAAKALNPSLQTFKSWLGQNKNRIPLSKTASLVSRSVRRCSVVLRTPCLRGRSVTGAL